MENMIPKTFFLKAKIFPLDLEEMSSSSCIGPKSICLSMTVLSRDANSMIAPRTPSATLASFEAKSGEIVAVGFEVETSPS